MISTGARGSTSSTVVRTTTCFLAETGGAGRDVTFGGAGADVFVFSAGDGADTIGDFEIGIDRLQIENLDTATAIAVAWGNGMRIEWGEDSLYLVGLDAGTTDPEVLWGP